MPNSALDPNETERPRRSRVASRAASRDQLSLPEALRWRSSLWRNVCDFLAAPARSPRMATAAASTLTWPATAYLTRAQTISLAFHGLLIVLLLIPVAVPPPGSPGPREDWLAPLYFGGWAPPKGERGTAKKKTGGGGSGGHDILPARDGAIPPSSRLQFTPPNDNEERKRLMVAPTVVDPDFLHNPILLRFGDPYSKGTTDSRGRGAGGSFGDGDGTGAGPGKGPGAGPGSGGGSGGDHGYRLGGRNGAGMPVCSYCPNPAFSDEAVKTKYQGSVVLRLVVTEEGKAANVSVMRGIGMGLDERALEAVKGWRFQPARGADGRPEAVWVTVEVMFRQF